STSLSSFACAYRIHVVNASPTISCISSPPCPSYVCKNKLTRYWGMSLGLNYEEKVVAAPLKPLGESHQTEGVQTKAAERNEADLISRVKNGEPECFYELARPYERAVFLAAISLVKNESDAADVAQEAILKAFKNLPRFRSEAKFSTWLIQITINEAKMKLRKDRRHLYDSIDESTQTDEGDYIPKDFADWRSLPSEALEHNGLPKALSADPQCLPAKYRSVIVLRDIQHLSIAETAKVLGISEPNVKTRLSRARLQMRDALAPGFDGAWSRGQAYEKVRPF